MRSLPKFSVVIPLAVFLLVSQAHCAGSLDIGNSAHSVLLVSEFAGGCFIITPAMWTQQHDEGSTEQHGGDADDGEGRALRHLFNLYGKGTYQKVDSIAAIGDSGQHDHTAALYLADRAAKKRSARSISAFACTGAGLLFNAVPPTKTVLKDKTWHDGPLEFERQTLEKENDYQMAAIMASGFVVTGIVIAIWKTKTAKAHSSYMQFKNTGIGGTIGIDTNLTSTSSPAWGTAFNITF